MTKTHPVHSSSLPTTAAIALALAVSGALPGGLALAGGAAPPEEEVEPIRPFSDLDLDHDGVLSSSEAHASPRIGADWQRLDDNDDGVLDRSEVRDLIDSAATAEDVSR